jgi:hypothetical protein
MSSITIDGTEYQLADLSDNAQAQLASMQAADQKIALLQADTAMMQTARNAYANALKVELPADKPKKKAATKQ